VKNKIEIAKNAHFIFNDLSYKLFAAKQKKTQKNIVKCAVEKLTPLLFF
jgi:hypothetical protein